MLNWSILLSMFLLILIAHSRLHAGILFLKNTPPTRSFVPPLRRSSSSKERALLPSQYQRRGSSFRGLIVEEPARATPKDGLGLPGEMVVK